LTQLGVLLLGLALTSCAKKPSSQNYFPPTGGEALYQTALDLQNGAQVLSLALRPGEEDLSTLAYLRVGRGANLLSAYWSNGEASAGDLPEEYPHYLAARRRAEAVAALTYLGGETWFLNLPDVVAARDSLRLRRAWLQDSVQTRLAQLIMKIKPDLILIARDRKFPEGSLQRDMMLADVLAAVQQLAPGSGKTNGTSVASGREWQVARVCVESGSNENAVHVPVAEKHPKWKKSYREIGEEAARFYQSVQRQRLQWREAQAHLYKPVYPGRAAPAKTLEEGLSENLNRTALAGLKWRLGRFAADLLEGNTIAATRRLAVLADSVSYYLERRGLLNALEVKNLYHWKGALDKLQCQLLGVTVDYELSDATVTALQLTFLTIGQITGLPEKGETFVFFGALPEGWVVNEGFERKFPYKPGERFNLLSPQQLDFNAPPATHGLNSHRATRTLTFHLIHRGPDSESSFIHRTDVRTSYAPRFLVEPLTPIVRMWPGEPLDVLIKNFSRDGVIDTVRVANEWATSNGAPFRVSGKESEQRVTLFLDWKSGMEEGTYRVPIQIAADTVAWFAARKFRADLDRNRRVGVLSGASSTPLQEALRRLGLRVRLLAHDKRAIQQMDSLDVLLIDRRALALSPEIGKLRNALAAFAQRGGHLVFLAQEAASWNAAALWEGLRLTATTQYDEDYPVTPRAGHALLTSPNALSAEDWQGWLFARAEHAISLAQNEGVAAPLLAAETGAPLLLTKPMGQGKMTYVNLALTPQLLNLHPGAFRLLANLVSY
jgi:hypothetical protein